MPVRLLRSRLCDEMNHTAGSDPDPRRPVGPRAEDTAQERLLRVLVVDDSLALLDLASELIDSLPFAEVVGQARSGNEALDRATELKPHVVVMDLAMPGMNGLEATRVLRSRPNAPAVVLMSVYEPESYDQAAGEAGAAAFCPKSELFAVLPVLLRSLAAARGAMT